MKNGHSQASRWFFRGRDGANRLVEFPTGGRDATLHWQVRATRS